MACMFASHLARDCNQRDKRAIKMKDFRTLGVSLTSHHIQQQHPNERRQRMQRRWASPHGHKKKNGFSLSSRVRISTQRDLVAFFKTFCALTAPNFLQNNILKVYERQQSTIDSFCFWGLTWKIWISFEYSSRRVQKSENESLRLRHTHLRKESSIWEMRRILSFRVSFEMVVYNLLFVCQANITGHLFLFFYEIFIAINVHEIGEIRVKYFPF